jgi:hypothetical protein
MTLQKSGSQRDHNLNPGSRGVQNRHKEKSLGMVITQGGQKGDILFPASENGKELAAHEHQWQI